MTAALFKLVNEPPVLVEEVMPDAPRALAAVANRAIQKSPDERYASAAEMRDAILDAMERDGLRATRAQLGAMVTAMFAPERRILDARIQRAMKLCDYRGPASLRPSASAGLSTGAVAVAVTSASLLTPTGTVDRASGVALPARSRASGPALPEPPRSSGVSSRVGAKSVAALFLACALVVAVVAFRHGTTAMVANADAARASATTPVSTPVTGEPTAPDAHGAAVRPAPAPFTAAPLATPTAIALAPDRARARGRAHAAPPAPRAAVAPAPAAAPTSVPPIPPPTAPTGALAAAPGYLSIMTYPWTRVTVDGRAVGTTPLVRVALAPGSHSVLLESDEQNLRKVVAIDVRSGETVSKTLELR